MGLIGEKKVAPQDPQLLQPFSAATGHIRKNMEDHGALVRAIVNGDRERFRTFVTEFQRLVWHIVSRMIPDVDDREDICQDVFVKVYQNLATFRHESKVSTWVAQITCNTCISARQRKRLPAYDTPSDSNDSGYLEIEASYADRPDARYESASMSASIAQEIDSLPAMPGLVLTLFHLEQMSLKDISEILKLPEGTVKSYLFRSRKMLKDRLVRRYNWETT